MSVTAHQVQCKSESEARNVAVSFADKLDTGELLTGTPTVTEETTSDLTISNVAVSVASLTINGITVITGKAVQFKVAGGSVQNYVINLSCTTDSTPAQTVYGKINLTVVPD